MDFRARKRKTFSLDMTPLIDVVFLLLLFFMISTTFIKDSEIKINLPQVSSTASTAIQASIEVIVTAKERIFIDGKPTNLKTLQTSIRAHSKEGTKKALLIRADGNVKHKLIVGIMDAGKNAGITKISVATALERKR